MWVRFLDKVSTGTLFNFGNPTRTDNPYGLWLDAFGFKLETYVINSTDEFGNGWDTYGDYVTEQNVLTKDTNEPFFTNSNTERFVQLVVRDGNNLRDSHTGMSWNGGYDRQVNIPWGTSPLAGKFTTTRIPENFNEWYFINATFNPIDIQEPTSGELYTTYKNNSDFWMNHIASNGNYTANSGLGNKCKVEILQDAGGLTVYPEVTRNGSGDVIVIFMPQVANSIYTALITVT